MLDPQSPVPLYHQLAEHLRREIAAGHLSAGEKIASEPELAQRHRIGRPTVRQATEALVREGLLERRRGSGTYVRAATRSVDLFSPFGTVRAFDRAGVRVVTRFLTPVILHEHPRFGWGFGFSRSVESDEGPVLVETFWFEEKVFPDLDRHDLANRSLAQFVAQTYRLTPTSLHQTFRVQPADDMQAQWLAVAPGFALLQVERELEFSGHGPAVRVDVACKTDVFCFTQSIATSHVHHVHTTDPRTMSEDSP